MAAPIAWPDLIPSRRARLAAVVACLIATASVMSHDDAAAKTPGATHCYGGVCHRVKTYEETLRLVGVTRDIVATHYDHPSVDPYNVGLYTSSGEMFDADTPARTSSSDLPDGTEIVVWHPQSRKAAHLRVNDFGPFMGNRTLDVTRGAAEALGFARSGVATLKMTIVWAPPDRANTVCQGARLSAISRLSRRGHAGAARRYRRGADRDRAAQEWSRHRGRVVATVSIGSTCRRCR